jgi:site-specific recombinase XerD
MGYSQYAVPVPVPRQPEPIGFSRVIKFWLSVKEGEVRENSSAGYEYISYKHVIPYFEKLGLAVHEIQLMDIQQYFFEMGKSLKPSTLDKHFTVINGALKFARSNLNLIYYNPAEDFTKPKKQQRMYSCFNVDELSDLLQMVEGSILEAPVILASSFGLRRSETLGLRWASLDHKARSIAINHTMCRGRKGYIAGDLVKEASSYRTFALEPDVREYLMRLYNHQRQMKLKYKDKYIDSDYICRWDNGRSIRPDYVSREFPKFLSANNLKVIRFHDLRHSAASNLLNAGFDIYEICEWLGHSDIRSTQRYLHLAFESKRKISKFMDNALFKKRKTITRYEEE